MTKKDLKDGMIVKTANGNKYLVMNGTLLNQNGITYVSRVEINEDLTHKYSADLNIMSVYRTDADCLKHLFNNSNLNVIWERRPFDYNDKVKVIDRGQAYTTCTPWFEKHEDKFDIEILLQYRYGECPHEGELYSVLFTDYDEEKILIGNKLGVYLMNMKGVKKVNE